MKAPTTPPAGALLFAIFNRLSNLPLFLLCPEEQFRFVHANEAVLQLSGHALEHLMTLRHPLHAKYPLIGIDQLWSQLDDSLHTEMDIRMNDGATRRLPVTLHSLAYEGTVYLLGYLHDQHVQRQLIEARQTTEQALAVRNRFLAHMSHELRTPLNGILGLSHLARDTESLALAHDYFQQIHRSGIHLQTILSDILDFCQIETGSIILNPVSFSLKNLIDDILQTVKTRAFGKHLVLRSDVDPALPVYLLGDVVRLRHILHPLVDNAVKFTEAGEVCVTVTLNRPTQPDLMQVRFIVKDTGMGISPENQSRLFHPFEQLDASDNRRHQGLGLGLALAGHLVKLMGAAGSRPF